MSTYTRLAGVFRSSDEITFDDSSKFVFFSDCHRGDNSKADDFAPNRAIYSSALNYYYTNGFTYIELGDGDELWENDRFSTLLRAHPDIYLQLQKFHKEGRLYMIWGNHDVFKKHKSFVQRNLYQYYNPMTQKFEPFLNDIKVHEGLILRYTGTPYKIFVVHGHQGDLLNDRLWPLARFLVRYLWRHLELARYRNPISPARNVSRMGAVESNIMRWVRSNHQMLIAGHTHHHAFPRPGDIPYFNDGCCVYHGYITSIEIQNGEIMLVKWSQKQRENGVPTITRDIIAGPEKVHNYFQV